MDYSSIQIIILEFDSHSIALFGSSADCSEIDANPAVQCKALQ